MKRFSIKRKSEKWVSNNRVLLGSLKKDPARNPNFDAEETKLLISLWGDPTVQRTLITTHRKHTVIAKLAEKMNEYGYTRSPEEINTRIKNLKCFYNRLKKDMDMGVINKATWKHFEAMDEIMTRSIFSVRPNEIPKPSLKYQLEIEQNEKEERNKLRTGNNVCGPSFGINQIEMSDTSVCLNDSVIMEYTNESDNLTKIKEEYIENDEKANEEIPVIVFKEEPPCDDVELQSSSTNLLTSQKDVSEYIQTPKSSSNAIVTSSSFQQISISNHSNPIQMTQTSTTNSNIGPYVITNQEKPMSTPGKISVIPANFLLQQQTTDRTKLQQLQPRPICTQPNVQLSNSIASSTGAGSMKVLLVNTFQNRKTTNIPESEASFLQPSLTATTLNTLQKNLIDSTVLQSSAKNSKQPNTDDVNSNTDSDVKILFNKLILMQNENNEIQRQRLEIERQRLEFEKAIAEKLLAALTSLNKDDKPEREGDIRISNKDSNGERHNDEQTIPTDFIEEISSFQLLTPKIERVD